MLMTRAGHRRTSGGTARPHGTVPNGISFFKQPPPARASTRTTLCCVSTKGSKCILGRPPRGRVVSTTTKGSGGGERSGGRRAHLSDLALAERLGREGAPGHPGRSLECSLRKHDSLCFVLSRCARVGSKSKTIKKLIFNFLLPEVHSHHLDSRLERCRVARTSTSHRHTSSQCHQTSSAEPRRGKTIASVTRTSGC